MTDPAYSAAQRAHDDSLLAVFRVPFRLLSMNQQSQAYGDWREQHQSYSSFVERFASKTDWDSRTGKVWVEYQPRWGGK